MRERLQVRRSPQKRDKPEERVKVRERLQVRKSPQKKENLKKESK